MNTDTKLVKPNETSRWKRLTIDLAVLWGLGFGTMILLALVGGLLAHAGIDWHVVTGCLALILGSELAVGISYQAIVHNRRFADETVQSGMPFTRMILFWVFVIGVEFVTALLFSLLALVIALAVAFKIRRGVGVRQATTQFIIQVVPKLAV